jgi:hypothetical protein
VRREGSGRDHCAPGVLREKTGHALIGAWQWIPAGQVSDPVRSLAAALPPGLEFRAKGQMAVGIIAEALGDGALPDFICGDRPMRAALRVQYRGSAVHLRRGRPAGACYYFCLWDEDFGPAFIGPDLGQRAWTGQAAGPPGSARAPSTCSASSSPARNCRSNSLFSPT